MTNNSYEYKVYIGSTNNTFSSIISHSYETYAVRETFCAALLVF